MKTLILDGAPHRTGDTAALLAALRGRLPGECRVIRAYDRPAAPCVDCRFCVSHPVCAKKDDMETLYRQVAQSDALVIASPLHFLELSGPLLTLLSRFQLFYCARRFQGVELAGAPKRGAILLTGGGEGAPDNALRTARCVLRTANVREFAPAVLSLRTDTLPAAEDAAALDAAREAAAFLAAGRDGCLPPA